MAVTASSFKTRYFVFTNVPDAWVSDAIADASRFVDDTWKSDDRDRGIMALAAHFLVTEGALSGLPNSAAFDARITSDKLGDAARTYGGFGGAGNTSEFATTAYGLAFLRVMRANVPAVVVV